MVSWHFSLAIMHCQLVFIFAVVAAPCLGATYSKKDKRGLYDYGTLGGYGVGGQVSFRGANYGQDELPVQPLLSLSRQQPIHIGTHIHTTVTKQFAVPVPHPVPVPVERRVPVAVPHPVPVAVPKPYPVAVPKPYAVPVDRPYPVAVDRPYAVPVPHPVPVPYDRPFPVGVPQPYAVPYAAAFPGAYGGLFRAPYSVKPYLRTEGLGLGLGSAIIH